MTPTARSRKLARHLRLVHRSTIGWQYIAPLVLLLFGPSSHAQSRPPEDERPTWSFQWENDLFAKDRSDRYYTNGLRLLYARPAWLLDQKRTDTFVDHYGTVTGEWLCTWGACDPKRAKVAVSTHGGQNMYTPQNLRSPAFNPYDRPYAGWLYLGQRTQLFDRPDADGYATRMQTLDISLGSVGPSAGAGKVQEEWHHLVNAPDPQGWSTQLRDEPGILLIYTDTRRIGLGSLWDTTPYWRASVGNVFTHVAVGTQFRVGRDLSGFSHFDPIPAAVFTAQSTADLRDPALAKAAVTKDSPLYAFLALEGRAVARNIFIDGNTWRDYPQTSFISRKPFVGDVTLGFSAKVWGGTRITYGHTWRTKEFTQDRPSPPGTPKPQAQRYGVIQVQWEH